jgi:dCMP deaminase
MTIHPADVQFAIQVTRLLALRSRATRARVGAVLWDTRTRNIVSVGYNGTPTGMANEMERDNVTLPTVIHAEQNCLGKMSWFERLMNHVQDRYMLFVTHAPCVRCSDTIIRTGIRHVRYLVPYGDMRGVQRLLKKQIDVLRIVE